VEEDVDELYGVAPEEFTARRKELVAAAKKRGDAEAAKLVAAARRPTAAAWVVNALVRADDTARARLGDLSERLRAAHASMDGARIRELSSEQRKLVDQLVLAGLKAADVSQPSAALRDDVVGTLQAAIADPDVAARLGRLEKAERWSGFGDFGSVTAVGAARKPKAPKAPKVPESESSDDRESVESEVAAATERVALARADVDDAEHALHDADDLLSERTAKLATARRRYEKLLETLSAAEREVETADEEATAAERAAKEAADRLAAAAAELHVAEGELARLDPPTKASR
jgi:hypothetical protein